MPTRPTACSTSPWCGPAGRLRLLRLLPRVYKGTHTTVPEVSTHRVRSVRLSSPGVTAYADGDPIGALPLTIDVAPAVAQRLHAVADGADAVSASPGPRADVASTWSRSSSGAVSLHARATTSVSVRATSASSWQLGAILQVLGDVGLLRLAHLVPQVLLEVASRLLTAAVGHFVLPVAAGAIPRSSRSPPAVHEAFACHDAGGS